MTIPRILLMLVALLTAFLLVQSTVLIWRINKGVQIARDSHPFENRQPGAPVRILVAGDSTGVGTGAKKPLDSVAGRISRDFPRAEIINRASDGAHVAEVVAQLGLQEKEHFDLVIIQVGGNDILGFTRLDSIRKGIERGLEAGSLKGDKVIFLSTGNVGLAPAFFAPLSWIYTRRTRQVRSIFMNAALDQGIEYVDLFQEKDTDPFLEDPERYYAPDFLHPGSEGYRLWYEEIKKQTSLGDFLQNRLP